MHLKAVWKAPKFEEPDLSTRDYAEDLVKMMGRLNLCSDEYKARQYDHEVKGLSVVKPFVGKFRDVQGDATVTMIEPLSTEGVILSSALLPRYSDIDTYHMAASEIDLGIRPGHRGRRQTRPARLPRQLLLAGPGSEREDADGEYKLAPAGPRESGAGRLHEGVSGSVHLGQGLDEERQHARRTQDFDSAVAPVQHDCEDGRRVEGGDARCEAAGATSFT